MHVDVDGVDGFDTGAVFERLAGGVLVGVLGDDEGGGHLDVDLECVQTGCESGDLFDLDAVEGVEAAKHREGACRHVAVGTVGNAHGEVGGRFESVAYG